MRGDYLEFPVWGVILNKKLLELLQMASRYLSENKLGEAGMIYQGLLADIPGQPDALYGMYRLSLGLGRVGVARRYLMDAIRQISLLSYRTELREMTERWRQEYADLVGKVQVEYYREADSMLARKSIVEAMPGVLRDINHKRYAQALATINKLETSYGLTPDLALVKFDCLQHQGDLEAAAELDVYLIKQFPDNPRVWLALGNIFSRVGAVQSAIASYTRLLQLEPNSDCAWAELGSLYLNRNVIDTAVKLLKKAIEINAHDISTWLNLSNALNEQQEIREALNVLFESRKQNPDSSMLQYAILVRVLNCGAYDEGKSLLVDLERMRKQGHADMLIAAAALQIRCGDDDGCIQQTLDIAKKRLPEYPTNKHARYSMAAARCIALIPLGRAGSLFFHSLIDGHPQIATIPGVYLKGFFGPEIWPRIRGVGRNWKNDLVHRFGRMFEAMFDASNPAPVPGDPLGSRVNIGMQSGLTSMGMGRNEVLLQDKDIFDSALAVYLAKFEDISPGDFIKGVHWAWECAKRQEVDKALSFNVWFYHIHNPNLSEYLRFRRYVSNAETLFIVREPLQGLESWMYQSLPSPPDVERLPDRVERLKLLRVKYGTMVDRLNSIFLMGLISRIEAERTWAVRLEDIKRNPNDAMHKIAEWMGVDFDETLMRSEFHGLEYWGPPSKLSINLRGFDSSNIERKVGVFFSANDSAMLEAIFAPWRMAFGYAGFDHSARETLRLISQSMDYPMDWEKKLVEACGLELQDLISMDIFEKRKAIIKNAVDRHENHMAQRFPQLIV